MFSNANLLYYMEQDGITAYALAQAAGVPYTTISRLKNGTMDINECTAKTVLKIATALGREMPEIMNPFPVMENVHDLYSGTRYYWKQNIENGKMDIHADIDGEKIIIHTGSNYNLPNRAPYYRTFAEFKIEDIISAKEYDKRFREIWEKTQKNERRK